MSDIKNFTFAPGLELRVIDRNGEPWFVAKDVADILDFRDGSRAAEHLDTDEKGRIRSPASSGRELVIINESGLYSLILKSRKPEAKAFKKWVTAEVLPTIRKTGGYMAPSVANLAETDPEQFLARAVLIAQWLRLSGDQGCAWPCQVRRRMSGTSPCRTGHPRTVPRVRSSTQRTV